jgi:hypothetical protein
MAELAVTTKRPDVAEPYFRNAIEPYPGHDETHVIYDKKCVVRWNVSTYDRRAAANAGGSAHVAWS